MSTTTTNTSGPTADPESRNWTELPADLTAVIFSKIGAIDVLTSVQLVCKSWFWICREAAMWRDIDMHNLGDLWDMEYNLEKMCRDAVDRSCGELVSINIEYFGTDELLDYISVRSKNLRSLRLVSCHRVSGKGLSAAIANLTSLEELDLSFCSCSQEALEAVGRLCPLLKILKLNNHGFRCPKIECNEEATAIAKNMPGLRQLMLFGNKLTNDGLLAILDGCPQLESLDLRQCFNINLTGNLEKRCVERIKVVRCPNDSTDDYEFNADVHDAYCSSAEEEDYASGISDFEFGYDEDDYYGFSDYGFEYEFDYDYDYDYMFDD